MGLCKDCKHWSDEPSGIYSISTDGWGQCTLTVNRHSWPRKYTLAFAVDAESYFAVLETAPNFGCVQFEEVKA